MSTRGIVGHAPQPLSKSKVNMLQSAVSLLANAADHGGLSDRGFWQAFETGDDANITSRDRRQQQHHDDYNFATTRLIPSTSSQVESLYLQASAIYIR